MNTKSRLHTIALYTLTLSLPIFFTLHAKETKKTENKKEVPYDEAIFDWTRVFAEVLHTVGQKHYKVANSEQCMIKAIDSFLTCLDPHSGFLDPKTYKAILESTSGEFFGIGIVIDNTRQQKD